MSIGTAPMTTAELLALPDDGVERWLIRGQLRERHPNQPGQSITIRNRFHSEAMSAVSTELVNWVRQQPEPRGMVISGEAGVQLTDDPDSTVGVDAAYVSADLAAAQGDESSLVNGIPVLIVEILSPSDTVEDLEEKLSEYRQAAVPLVWVMNPYDRTIKVHQRGTRPKLFNEDEELTAEPFLPGFRVPVGRLFR
jgi:Uma2 family endonuclease